MPFLIFYFGLTAVSRALLTRPVAPILTRGVGGFSTRTSYRWTAAMLRRNERTLSTTVV